MTNPPTEGVKLDEAARIIDPGAFSRRGFTGDPDWHPDDDRLRRDQALAKARQVLSLYGPQAAKRIEELEADNARLLGLASSAHANKIATERLFNAAEARALKAERQRDEAVGALEKVAKGHRPPVGNGRPPNTFTGGFDSGTTWAADIARSVLSSIREG